MRKLFSALFLFLFFSTSVYAIDVTRHDASGSGNVKGASSSTDNTIVRMNGTTGKRIQGSLVTIDDSNNMAIPAADTDIHVFTDASWDDDDLTWTMTGTGPLVHVTGNTTAVTATNTEAIVAGTTYKVTITGTGGTATATYTLGGVTGTTIAASGAIAITDYITASTTASMIITPANTCTVSISAITIEKLTNATGDLTVDGNLTIRSPSTFNSSITLSNGQLLVSKGTVSNLSLGLTDAPLTGIYMEENYILFGTGGIKRASIIAQYIEHVNGTLLLNDTYLTRDAANTLALRNSTNAQTFSLYETYTDASNYESYSLDAGVTTADTFTIKANTAGTGADNLSIALTPAGTGAVKVGKTVLNSSAVTCVANACTDVPASPFIIITTDATAGADVLTIADGITGEIRIITLKTDGTTDLAITPTNFANGTIITLDTAGESAMIQFDGAKWFVIATYGGVVS